MSKTTQTTSGKIFLSTTNVNGFENRFDFSRELEAILTDAKAQINITVSPHGRSVTITKFGTSEIIFSPKELAGIGKWKRFLSEAIEKSAKDANKNEKALLYSVLERNLGSTPDHVSPACVQQFHLAIANFNHITKNKEHVSSLTNDLKEDFKKRVLEIFATLAQFEIDMMEQSVMNRKVSSEDRAEKLLKLGVPSWFMKFMKPVANIEQIVTLGQLFFPKNFLRGLSYSTEEILSTGFLLKNQSLTLDPTICKIVQKMSGLENELFQDLEREPELLWVKLYKEFHWNLTYVRDLDELYEMKKEGKGIIPIPVVKDKTNLPTAVREQYELIHILNYQINAILRYQVQVPNSIENFWVAGFKDALSWEPTGRKTIYHFMSEDVNFVNILKDLHYLGPIWKKQVVSLVLHKLGVLSKPKIEAWTMVLSYDYGLTEDLKVNLDGVIQRTDTPFYYAKEGNEISIIDIEPWMLEEPSNKTDIGTVLNPGGGVSLDDKNRAKKKLGFKITSTDDTKKRSSAKGLKTRGTLKTNFRKEFDKIGDMDGEHAISLYKAVVEWITGEFPNNETLQQISGDFILGGLRDSGLDFINTEDYVDTDDEDA